MLRSQTCNDNDAEDDNETTVMKLSLGMYLLICDLGVYFVYSHVPTYAAILLLPILVISAILVTL